MRLAVDEGEPAHHAIAVKWLVQAGAKHLQLPGTVSGKAVAMSKGVVWNLLMWHRSEKWLA